MNNKQTLSEVQSPANTSQVCGTGAEPLNAMTDFVCLSPDCNPDERLRVNDSRLNVSKKNRSHPVFVLSITGKPLTPTTAARARKLLKAGVANPVWSRFNTFGIQMASETRNEIPCAVLGVDNGSKYEGYSVVVGEENSLNVKLDLPSKTHIVKKAEARRRLRRSRRSRKCRRRPARFSNRKRKSCLGQGQTVIVNSRLKIVREFFRVFPIKLVAFEDVKFRKSKKVAGTSFTTVELGKRRIKQFFESNGAKIHEYRGYETKKIREKYGYLKSSAKSDDTFSSHCSDSLAIAVETLVGKRIEPGLFLAVDDSYRPMRRKLHHEQPAKGGIRPKRSRGTVMGLRKGLLVGTSSGKIGQLCGEIYGKYRYLDLNRNRQNVKKLAFSCGHFIVRKVSCPSIEVKS